MVDFVVDLVEEHVDLGGSQFSESILERRDKARDSNHSVCITMHTSLLHPRVVQIKKQDMRFKQLGVQKHSTLFVAPRLVQNRNKTRDLNNPAPTQRRKKRKRL